eukprot:gnl/Chilomastix_cuspidata/1711.p1 GENE.gnl/Chilomastix_cuspidata/1711~~gnl/Chilomastix_cuspidata/1711.p1  ORF type:complete len:494 (+),score=156.25 gnl/Chilomastix_cuspidata/1711:32-1513(+)
MPSEPSITLTPRARGGAPLLAASSLGKIFHISTQELFREDMSSNEDSMLSKTSSFSEPLMPLAGGNPVRLHHRIAREVLCDSEIDVSASESSEPAAAPRDLLAFRPRARFCPEDDTAVSGSEVEKLLSACDDARAGPVRTISPAVTPVGPRGRTRPFPSFFDPARGPPSPFMPPFCPAGELVSASPPARARAAPFAPAPDGPGSLYAIVRDTRRSRALARDIMQMSAAARRQLFQRLSSEQLLHPRLHGATILLQAFADAASPPDAAALLRVISDQAAGFLASSDGLSLLVNCLCLFRAPETNFIFGLACNRCAELCSSAAGAAFFRACLDHAGEVTLPPLVGAACREALSLLEHECGNYIIQHLLTLKPPSISPSSEFVRLIEGREHRLCRHPLASQALRKCIEVASRRIRARLVERIIMPDGLLALIRDEHALGVVCAIMSNGTNKERIRIATVVNHARAQLVAPRFALLLGMCDPAHPQSLVARLRRHFK